MLTRATVDVAENYGSSNVMAASLKADVVDPLVELESVRGVALGADGGPPPLGPHMAAILTAVMGRPTVLLTYNRNNDPNSVDVQVVGHVGGGALDQVAPIVLLNYHNHFWLVASCGELRAILP